MLRSLTARVVLLAVLVALASSLVTSTLFGRALGATNRDQASIALASAADSLAAAVTTRTRVPAQARRLKLFERIASRQGWVAEVVAAGHNPATIPFSAADIASAADDTAPVERQVAGVSWLVVGRPAGDQTVLVARRLADASRLTAAQRRRALMAGGLGLLGGGLAGLALVLPITRTLARLSAAARRLTAGERGVPIPPEGPTEVRDVAHALGALSGALAASEQRQRQFLLAVSHELRTPLTAVAGYAEALQDGAVPPAEVPHAASVISQEAARLQRRVEDLMALARLEADDFRLVPAPTDVGALLRAAYSAFAPRAASAGVALALQIPPTGPVVVTDGERLRQAVDALADNALKVLPAGAPLVLACEPARDGGVRVEVRDGGPGLAPEDLAVAFERGRLTERFRGRRPVGSGVGLALVGELARRMGGSAEALPAPEGGVTFAVTLPPVPPTIGPPTTMGPPTMVGPPPE